MSEISVGTRVAYSRKFLRSTGTYTGPRAFARGEIAELHELPGCAHSLAVVRWDDEHSSSTLTCNLVREDRLHLEPV